MLLIIEILFIIISFSLYSDNFICVFFWLDIVGRILFVFLGSVNVVFMVVLLMFIVVILVGVVSKIVGFLGFIGVYMYLYVFIIVW